MLFEFIYVAIALVVGILKWQQARTGRDKAIAIVSAALWPDRCVLKYTIGPLAA